MIEVFKKIDWLVVKNLLRLFNRDSMRFPVLVQIALVPLKALSNVNEP